MIVASCAELLLLINGMEIHGLVTKLGFINMGNSAVGSSFIYFYSMCGCMEDGALVFDEMPVTDVVAWTALVIGYVQNDESEKGLERLCEMHRVGGDGERPNSRTFEGGFKACGNLGALLEGKCLHGLVVKTGIGSTEGSCIVDVCYWCLFKIWVEFRVLASVLANAGYWSISRWSCYQLSAFGVWFGLFSIAEKLFDRVRDGNKESWNIMVFEYSKVGLESKCLELFTEMQHLGIEFDSNSLVSVISSCSRLGATRLGRSLHCYVIKNSMRENVSIANSLIDMYGKSGNSVIAWKIFSRARKDTVTWNTLISSYIRSGRSTDALGLFDKMVSEGFKPNLATLVTVLSACSHIASLEKGEQIHSYAKDEGFEFDISLSTALVDMYAKCGQLDKSRNFFDAMKEKDVISWNVMISGYGMHGDAESAIEIFKQMEQSNVRPNELTFLAVLSACTHAGLVGEGKNFFDRMRDYALSPNLKHYSCMVDL
ncbi:hypothetical protein C3L33_17519, partial [Rhododendron williamsianum]